ncbi:MAG: ParA family protein [bacterium]|nr:ParA family protein [bacterium]
MPVISVANQKGGVGKTTVCLLLAEGLARLGKRVLLVDLDPQFNLSYFYLGDRVIEHEEKNVGHVLLGKLPVEEVLVELSSNLWLLPSYLNLSVRELELVSSYNRERKLRRALEPLLDQFEYVIIDNPPSLSIFLVNSLVASNYLLVPLEPSYFAVVGMELMLGLLKFIRAEINPSLELLGVVINKYSKRSSIPEAMLVEFRKKYDNTKILGILPNSVIFEKSHAARKSIFDLIDKRNKHVKKAIEKFIEEVIKYAK